MPGRRSACASRGWACARMNPASRTAELAPRNDNTGGGLVRLMLLTQSGGDMYQRFAILLSAGALAVTVACAQTDAGITSAVKTKMAADNTVKASEINVDTHNHVVTLNGTVGSAAEKERAV